MNFNNGLITNLLLHEGKESVCQRAREEKQAFVTDVLSVCQHSPIVFLVCCLFNWLQDDLEHAYGGFMHKGIAFTLRLEPEHGAF